MKNQTDIIGGLFLLLLGIGATIGALRMHVGSPTSPQPGFFPFLGGIALVVFASVIFLKARLGQKQEKVAFGEIRRPALLLGVVILLVLVLDRLGYVIGTLIATGLILRIMNVKSWKVLILTSFCLSFGTYILFDKLLGIELPVGILVRLGL
jgi:putative tricarboxylic transport membrane protein